MRERGLEPPRVLPHKILSLARLPVPPLPHAWYGTDYTGVLFQIVLLLARLIARPFTAEIYSKARDVFL
jgi:hypothetical protein